MEPTVEVKVEPPEVMVETIAEVVMAEEPAYFPCKPISRSRSSEYLTVVVVVPVATVLNVVAVVVATAP